MTVPVLETFRTGVPGLDEVLGGGLWHGGLYLLEGLPGTGKTILANQAAFARAAIGEQTLYVSLISESHGKLIHHLQTMSFFDAGLVGDRVNYVSGYRSMVDQGLPGLFEFLVAQLRQKKTSLVVIEGFSSAEYLKGNLIDLAQFMHQLNALAAATRCTVLVVTHEQGTDDHPEHTLVDGVIEVRRVNRGMRTHRYLKVHKIRGRDPILGEHFFSITSDGVTVHPRLEAVVTRDPVAPARPQRKERLAFGVAGLDRMLNGGLVAGGTTAILGAPGSGKTVLALKYLEEGLKSGGRALFFGFYEAPDRILDKAASVGIDLRSWHERGSLCILWRQPLEFTLDELAWTLLEAVSKHRPQRLVIDGIRGLFAPAFEREDLSSFLTALTSRLRASYTDTVVTEELALPDYGPQAPPHLISPVIENVILLRYFQLRGRTSRFVSLLKVRESDYESAVKELRISSAGLEVVDPSGDAADTLHGVRAGDAVR